MTQDIDKILNKSIKFVKGVGEARANLFNRLNVFTLYDIITHFPREYEDRSNLKKIIELQDGEDCSFKGTIASRVSEIRPRRGLAIYKLNIVDDTGMIIASWFNQHFIKNIFKINDEYVFYGKISRKYRSLEVSNPVYEKLSEKDMKNTCRIVPVYHSTGNLTQNAIRMTVRNALDCVTEELEEFLPDLLRSKYDLSELNYSIHNIHFPSSDEDFKNARNRLVFEEFLLLQIALLNTRNYFDEDKNGISFKSIDEINTFIESLPFKLTNAQQKVFMEIEKDMESTKVMNRLVQGDVGSGKTIVAVLSMFKAIKNGYQTALMVPTEILAKQHYASINKIFERFDIRVEIITGSQTKKQKEKILENLKSGNINAIIGTHALIEDNVEFDNLGLVITDEQHRFGVRQRLKISKKGNNPDIIVMTATPIPRTLALILYGDLDISIIDELPPGRKPIETYCVDNSMRDRLNNFVRKKVLEGQQVYIVCPLVEESESVEAKSATELAEKISRLDFQDLRVGLMHGKMKSTEKEETMNSFKNGDIDILVSTTVIEVGVDVPNATIMIIENADRFGLAQLHQLRGRVGRGSQQSYCLLVSDNKSQISKERMNVMQKTCDGFIISEKDLQLRGPGEFFGTRQHGLPDLKIANIYRDMDILKKAQEAAMEIVKEDRLLEKEQNKKMKKYIYLKYGSKLNEQSFN